MIDQQNEIIFEVLDDFHPNEPDDEKIIQAMTMHQYQGVSFDDHEIQQIKRAFKIWEAMPIKCSKIQYIKLFLSLGMRTRETNLLMHTMVSRGCAKSFKEENDSENCSSIKEKGSCSKTQANT